MAINHNTIPKNTPLIGYGGGFGAVGGYGRAFGETLVFTTIIADVFKPRIALSINRIRISIEKEKLRISK